MARAMLMAITTSKMAVMSTITNNVRFIFIKSFRFSSFRLQVRLQGKSVASCKFVTAICRGIGPPCNLFDCRLNNDFPQGKDVVFGLSEGRVGVKVEVAFGVCGYRVVFAVPLQEGGDQV